VVVCGWDDAKYAVFSFDSRSQTQDDDGDDDVHDDFDDEEDEDSIFAIADDDENDVPDDESESNDATDAPKDDIIASNSNRTYTVDSPIQNPRLYWLVVVESKVRKATDQWMRLIDEVGESIERQVCALPSETDAPRISSTRN
jgi:hypothetical protein